MTTNRLLMDLFRALAAEDFLRASAVATTLCNEEEKKGHRVAARQLRGALKASPPKTSHLAQPGAFLQTALKRLQPDVLLAEVVLTPNVQEQLNQFAKEWKRRDALKLQGILPRTKLLFHGPPGCGKSLTAQALGKALELPVYLVRFDAVIGSFLGQTAIHLRELFQFAETTPCILLLDELDALGKRRGNPLDVGELDRIVISLLQELEHAQPMGIVVATTNLADHLDEALWRRFDIAVQFDRPTKAVLRKFCTALAGKYQTVFAKDILTRAENAPSFAEAEKIAIDEVRRQVVG